MGGQVGVERGAGQQQPPALPRELLLGQALHRQDTEAGEAQHPGLGLKPGGQPGADRRERPQQRVEQRCQALPQAVEAPPGVTVAGGVGIEGGGRLVKIGRQDRAPAVGQGGRAQHQRRPPPAQPVAVEVLFSDERTGDAAPSG